MKSTAGDFNAGNVHEMKKQNVRIVFIYKAIANDQDHAPSWRDPMARANIYGVCVNRYRIVGGTNRIMCIEHYRHRLGNFGLSLLETVSFIWFLWSEYVRSSTSRWRCCCLDFRLHATIPFYLCTRSSPFSTCTSVPRAANAIIAIDLEMKRFLPQIEPHNRTADQQKPSEHTICNRFRMSSIWQYWLDGSIDESW